MYQVIPDGMQVGVKCEQSIEQYDSIIVIWPKSQKENLNLTLKHADNKRLKWFWSSGSQSIRTMPWIDSVLNNNKKKKSVPGMIMKSDYNHFWKVRPLEIHFHLFIRFPLPCLKRRLHWITLQNNPLACWSIPCYKSNFKWTTKKMYKYFRLCSCFIHPFYFWWHLCRKNDCRIDKSQRHHELDMVWGTVFHWILVYRISNLIQNWNVFLWKSFVSHVYHR